MIEIVERQGKLPSSCVVVIPTGKCLGTVRLGVSGYYAGPALESPEAAHRMCLSLNDAAGVSPLQAECMLVGSMFGWEVPGADPDHYNADEVQRIEDQAHDRRAAI